MELFAVSENPLRPAAPCESDQDKEKEEEDLCWTAEALRRETQRPLAEELLTQSRACWWCLTLTGMVWGDEQQWAALGNSQLRLCGRTLTLTSSAKGVLCRVWCVLFRSVLLASAAAILTDVIGESLYHSPRYHTVILLAYFAILLQGVAAFTASCLVLRRIHSPAPLHLLRHFDAAVARYGAFFLAYSLCAEVVPLAKLWANTFFLGFLNFTLLPCLLFIVADVRAAESLVRHLQRKLERGVPAEAEEYALLFEEIARSNRDSWYMHTLMVLVAAVNVVGLVVSSFTLFSVWPEVVSFELAAQFGKEIIFSVIVFSECARVNALSAKYVRDLGLHVALQRKPVHGYLLASLRPIAFKLGGLSVTWRSVALQLLSLLVGAMVILARSALVSFLFGN